MHDSKLLIAFVGGGNMAEAMIGGLCTSGYPTSLLQYSEPLTGRREYMQRQYPSVKAYETNSEAVRNADVVVLAVKPQALHVAVAQLCDVLADQPQTLIISIAAGITTTDIQRWLKADQAPLVRMMPNTPSLIGEGATALFATHGVSDTQRGTAETIMGSVSREIAWVDDESMMDAVTGVSGSGPAYFFMIMEALQNAGIAAGLPPDVAKTLTMQTCIGAGKMAMQSEDDLATLRRKVTSPNGTTEAALRVMDAKNISRIIHDVVDAATNRSREIAREFGQHE